MDIRSMQRSGLVGGGGEVCWWFGRCLGNE